MKRNPRRKKSDNMITYLIVGAAAFIAWQYFKKPKGVMVPGEPYNPVFLPGGVDSPISFEDIDINRPFEFYQEYQAEIAGRPRKIGKITHAI